MQRPRQGLLQTRPLLGVSMLLAAAAASETVNPETCKEEDLPIFPFSEIDVSIYEHTVVYGCKAGAVRLHNKNNKTTCINGSWTPLSDPCDGISWAVPPDSLDDSYNGTRTYPYEIVPKYHCNETLLVFGAPFTSCDIVANNEIKCANPVVPDGIKLSGFRDYYTYGSSITFECKIGYFLIGSYFIRCEENNSWVPEVPSCKKIFPEVCGAPVMPKGSVYPLLSEYKTGNIITVSCHPNYSFFDETTKMTVTCKGYNQWDPPIQPCLSRTSPDTTELYIHNGRIIQGGKKYYNLGDEVTVQCNTGYVLIGSSKINYIGGKKWFPNIPTCSLSVFLKLLIAASTLPLLILTFKTACKKCSQQRQPIDRTMWHVHEVIEATKIVSWATEGKEGVAELQQEYQKESRNREETLTSLVQ